jgi:DNA processing protein
MQLLDQTQRRGWIRLSQSENVRPATFRQLISRYGSAAAALEALPELSEKGGLARPIRVFSIEDAEAVMEQAEELGTSFVLAGEPGYPPLLYHIPGAPALLCVKGNLALAELQAVAIVGARNASAGGRKFSAKKGTSLFRAWPAASIRQPMKQHLMDGLRQLLPVALIIFTRQKMLSCKSLSARMACC